MSSDAPVDERTLRTIIEAAPDGSLVVAAGGRIRLLTAQVERLFGYSREELIGERVELLVPESLRGNHGRHRAGYATTPVIRPIGPCRRSS